MATRAWTVHILDWEKLHRLVGPTPLGVSALTRRPRDADAEARVQKLADVEVEGQRSEGQRGPESKSGGPIPAGLGPELEDK